MNDKNAASIPEPIVQLQRQLDQFRSAQPHRAKIPEGLWQAAVELSRQHGLYAVAYPLRLDYMGLKRRLEGASKPAEKKMPAPPGFVELIAAHPAGAECVIEFESQAGSKMRITLPPVSYVRHNPLSRRTRPQPVLIDATPIEGPLCKLQPLEVEQVRRTAQEHP